MVGLLSLGPPCRLPAPDFPLFPVRSFAIALTLAVLLAGCTRKPPEALISVNSAAEVHVVKPQRRNLTCRVEQPGFVEAYEQTAIYAKVSGFIQQYYVDIGQHVKKGDPIVEIFVPELNEEHQQKVAQVGMDRTLV